ncbi:MAG: acyltransferase family protein, partial [Edaphobacter sp.]
CLGGLAIRICLLVSMPHGNAYEWCYAELPTHMDGLLFGALAAICIRTLTLERTLRLVRKILPGTVLVMGLVLVRGGPDFHSTPMILVGFPALAAVSACICLLALEPGSFTNRFGSLSALRFIGRYSYGMYVYHILFWPGLSWIQPWLQVRLHSIVLGGVCFTLLMLGGTMVLAVASYELYEKQWLKLKNRFAYDKSQPLHVG